MKFEKGHKKVGGKEKGTVNKTTAKAKELILLAIDEQSIHFNETMLLIKDTSPNEWAKIMVKLFDFVLPKKLDLTTQGEKINTPVSSWANDSTKPKI